MNGEFFLEMVETKLIPAITSLCPWAKKAIVQLDSAGGHSVKVNISELNKLGEETTPSIKFLTQPTRSPDCNVLDLGIWNSLQLGVPEIKYEWDSEIPIQQKRSEEHPSELQSLM